MTVRIVDFLKVVYVQHHNAEENVTLLNLFIKLNHPTLIGGGVSQSRQRVSVRQSVLEIFVLTQIHDHIFKGGAEHIDLKCVAVIYFNVVIALGEFNRGSG